MDWIRTEAQLPEDGVAVLVAHFEFRTWMFRVAFHDRHVRRWWYGGLALPTDYFSWWQSIVLPEPPK